MPEQDVDFVVSLSSKDVQRIIEIFPESDFYVRQRKSSRKKWLGNGASSTSFTMRRASKRICIRQDEIA